jgi:hypothetical protein
MLQESKTLHVFFANMNLKLPGRSTLTELVNAVTHSTRGLLLRAQLAYAMQLKLDDFAEAIVDSTHVAGNTEWPTDSRLVIALVSRLLRVGGKLDRLGLPRLDSAEAEALLKQIIKLDREIEFSRGKKDSSRIRQRRYGQLLKKAGRAHAVLAALVAPLARCVAALDVLPSRKQRASDAGAALRADLDALSKVIKACEARVLRGEKVAVEDKVLSTSDRDAGFIKKGQRDPVIGYKPQIARSGLGLITALLLPQGNAADSKQLLQVIDAVAAHTRVVPFLVSVDDGYASFDNRRELKRRGSTIVSIKGAKGRAITSAKDWNDPAYAAARNMRSAVESLMFTLKQGYHFGEVARRGRVPARAEMLEKALAYNICQIVCLRRAAETAATPDESLPAAG